MLFNFPIFSSSPPPSAKASKTKIKTTSHFSPSLIITSGFGERMINGKKDFHPGYDISLPLGTPLYAPSNGAVTVHPSTDARGNWIAIKDQSGWTLGLLHLSAFTGNLAAHTIVKKGQLLGYSGNTGKSTGPHLHVEMRDPKGVPHPIPSEDLLHLILNPFYGANT